MNQTWSTLVRLHELARGPLTVRLEPDATQRSAIAKALGLEGLPALTADLVAKPWMDGVEIVGRFDAVVEQACAVSLERFEQALSGTVAVRAVPAGSPHAPEPHDGEVDYDPEAPDPPDLLQGEAIDLAAYVVEHLSLEIDPFARKPGVEFEYATPDASDSPFAALRALKAGKP